MVAMRINSETKSKSGPTRTCLGCGRKRQQKEFIRFVAGCEGQIAIDDKGRMPGRGAYCCPDEKCLAGFVKKSGRVARALRCKTVECGGILDMVRNRKK